MKHVFPIDEDALFERANDLRISPRGRSRILHDLMDHAKATRDNELWHKIGLALIRAREIDDLSTRVSDHFVDLSPDEVFKEVAKKGPRFPFNGWSARARKLGVTPQLSTPVFL